MESPSSLSDYSEDFEEYDSSKSSSSKPTLATADVTFTPKRSKPPPAHPVTSRTDPGQRKVRSHYNPSTGRINNFRQGKGRILSERIGTKRTPFSPRDRELSAKLHSIKKLQNQLTDCQRELTNSKKENKLLTRLQVRQERELTRVATQEGELPHILARHAEEMRILKEQLKRSHELSATQQDKVSNLQTEVQKLKKRGKKLEHVAKQKNLLERESLTLQLQEAKEQIQQKDKKLRDLEKGMELLNKTHGHEIRALMVKNKALSQELDTSKERADKLFSHLKERAKEMDVMNIYSQRMGRSTLNNSTLTDVVEDKFSQTDLSCPPRKNVSLQTKKTIQSSSSQTHVSPTPTHETRTTQTDSPPVAVQPLPTQLPQALSTQALPSPPATVDPPPAVTSPGSTKQDIATKSSPPPQQQPIVPNEETQRKNILLSKLRELDSKKEPPASQPATTVSLQTAAAENTGIKHLDSGTEPATQLKSNEKLPAGPTPQEREAEKKKLLLAKLMAIDKSSDPKGAPGKSETNIKPVRTYSGQSSSSSIQSWQADTTDNLHRGKPAFFSEDDPFGKQKKLSGKRTSTGSLVKSESKLSNKNATADGYKPAFGRRARGGETTPSNSDRTTTNSIFGDSEKATKPIFNERRKESLGVFETESSSGAKDYPWEKRISLKKDNSLHNQSMVFGPASNSSLLPLRPKADTNRVDMIPDIMAEPDDIEEIVL